MVKEIIMFGDTEVEKKIHEHNGREWSYLIRFFW